MSGPHRNHVELRSSRRPARQYVSETHDHKPDAPRRTAPASCRHCFDETDIEADGSVYATLEFESAQERERAKRDMMDTLRAAGAVDLPNFPQ